MRFTDTAIKKLKPKSERYEVFEDGRPGFGLRISSKGLKTWIFLYRYRGLARRMSLGRYPHVGLHEAHLKEAEARKLLDEGIDPGNREQARKAQERGAPTVASLVKEYIERHAKPNKRSWRQDARLLEKEVIPHWGRRKARDIRRRDVILLLDRIIDRGAPVTANRLLTLLKKLFNFALSRDILESTPVAVIQPPTKERPRDRVLSESEIQAFWHGLDRIHTAEPVKRALRFILLTGQRGGEVLNARWDQIDKDRATWTLPGELTKNGRIHTVPLSRQAMALLEENDSPYVFPTAKGTRCGSNALNRLTKRYETIFEVSKFTPHDLRRTAASGMTRLGIPRLIVAKVLNHSESGVTAVYDRYAYESEMRQALGAWGRKVEKIVFFNGKEFHRAELSDTIEK